jgi:GTP-binding protein
MKELESFSEELVRKPMILIASKIDAAQDPDRVEALRRLASERDLEFFRISSVTGEGIDALKFALAGLVCQTQEV